MPKINSIHTIFTVFSPLRRLQNCHLFLTDNLEKTWKDFLTEERNSQTLDSIQREASATPAASAASTIKKGAGIVATMASRVRKKKGTAINKHDLVQVRHMTVTCYVCFHRWAENLTLLLLVYLVPLRITSVLIL